VNPLHCKILGTPMVRMLLSAGEFSLFCARLVVGCVTTTWVNHLPSFSQQGQLSLPSFWGQ